MTTIDYEALPLSEGAGGPDNPCLQQKAALVHAHIHGYLDTAGLAKVLTDHPCWQNRVITEVGIYVNDHLPTGGDWFARLDKLTPRMVAASVCADQLVELRVNARLLCWLAREVLHLFEDQFPGDDRPRKAIETREAWLRGEATGDDCQKAAAEAAEAAGAERLLQLLEQLCDQHDKAKAEEGAALDDGWMRALADARLITDTEALS